MSYTNGITSSPLLQTLMNQADSVGQTRTARTNTIGTTAAKDSAALSTAANALQQTASEDASRADKIRSVQAAVASGTYNVAPSAVAEKLVQNLLGR